MTDKFLDKYKEEDSESSASGEDDVEIIKRGIAKQKLDAQSEPKEQSQGAKRVEKKEDVNKVSLYTFDPRSIIEEKAGSLTSRGYAGSKALDKPAIQLNSPIRDFGYSTLRTPRETTIGTSTGSRYVPTSNLTRYKNELDYQQFKTTNEPPKSFQYNFKDETGFTDFKSENDYRAFGKEFDNEFGDRQRDIPDILRQLTSRIKRLQMLGRDLSAPNVDMMLLKTRLAHELETTQSDLNDANSSITLLMNDRAKIKDTYCHLKLRNKEMKNFTKGIEENIRA